MCLYCTTHIWRVSARALRYICTNSRRDTNNAKQSNSELKKNLARRNVIHYHYISRLCWINSIRRVVFHHPVCRNKHQKYHARKTAHVLLYSPLLPSTYVPSKAKRGWGTEREWYSIFRAIRSDNAYELGARYVKIETSFAHLAGSRTASRRSVNAERGERPTIIAVSLNRVRILYVFSRNKAHIFTVRFFRHIDVIALKKIRQFIYIKKRFIKYWILYRGFFTGIASFNNSALEMHIRNM